jgi:uncharacterized protein (TIGR04255 family)
MAKIRQHLARAPISEALIDLQVNPAAGVGLESVRTITQALKGRYEPQGPIFELQTQWSVPTDGDPSTTSAARELGVRLHSTDGKYVLQARTSGFTLSRLEPYENWDALLSEARSLWKTYADALEIEAVRRVATRFINNLKLPMKAGEVFEMYLTTPPQVPDELPQGVLGFMQRVVVLKPELDLKANVIQLLQEGIAPADHIPVILDIDVYKQVSMPPDSSDIWPLLAELRVFKNAIFFASLTETAVGLFE